MGLKTWARRRALGSFRITDERTRAAAQLGPDWLWPYWLERQLDPASPAFIPHGHLPVVANLTARNWTMVGSLGSAGKAIVDPRGLVTPRLDGWSLDWWIGADDRWHFPSRETGVRQRLLDNSPVVETAMRVPSGDAVQRVYGVPGDEDLCIVEIENRSPIPFAVALAIRPYNPEGLAVVERIGLVDNAATVDGRPALLFPKAPARMAASTFHDGDVVHTVTSGAAPAAFPANHRCDVGLAQAAFIFPLAHTAVLRVAIPLQPEPGKGRTLRRVERVPEVPKALPPAEAAAKGWAAQMRRGMQLDLPPGRLADAVEANRAFLLLFHDGADIPPGPSTASVVVALDRYGFHKEAGEAIASFAGRRHADGSCGAALWAIAEHWRVTRDLSFDDISSNVQPRIDLASVEKGVPALTGQGPWGLRGLLDGAELLRAGGRGDAAAAAEQHAADVRRHLDDSLHLVAERLADDANPGSPRHRLDHDLIGLLAACYPLRLIGPHDPRLAAAAEAVRRRCAIGPAVFQAGSRPGLSTCLTLQLGFVELEGGDRRALDRLQWLLDAAAPTFTWPEAVHPHLGGGCAGDGHHGQAAAGFLSLVRNLLVRETDDGLALCSMAPDEWAGQNMGVQDAPTHVGRLSYAVRWHGDRPALLWELDLHEGVGPVRLTAPGLDPTWSTMEPKGEALLAPQMTSLS